MPKLKLKSFLNKVKEKKAFKIGIILLIILIVVGVNLYRSNSHNGLLVQTVLVGKKELGETVFASGTVEMVEKQEVHSYGNKLVKEIAFRPGDEVKKGDVLAILESSVEEARLMEARAILATEEADYEKTMSPSGEDLKIGRAEFTEAEVNYHNSKNLYERSQVLFSEGAISAEELEKCEKDLAGSEALYLRAQKDLRILEKGPAGVELKAIEAKVERARAAVTEAEEDLARCIIQAQMDGTVVAVEKEEGEATNAGDMLMTIGNPGSLQVKVGIGEADAGRIKPGQEVEIESSAFPERKFSGKVSEIARAAVIDRKNNTQQVEVPVKISINNDEEALLPGFSVDLKIISIPEKERLVIAYEAIVEDDDKKTVWLVKGGKVQKRLIKTGILGDLETEIIEGLQEGNKIIVNPPADLQDGQKIREISPSGKKEAEI